MRTDLVRALPVDVEVTGRTLEGQALAWDVLYEVTDDGRSFYHEGFRRHAFADSLAQRSWCELRPEHADERIGQVTFHESERGLVFVATIERGPAGDTELEHVRTGRRDGVSIRYTALANERKAPPWWRTRASLRELSLTARPQYGADARVLAMRAHAHAPAYVRPGDIDGLLAWVPPDV